MGRVSTKPLPPLNERFTYAFSGISKYDRHPSVGYTSLLYFVFNDAPSPEEAEQLIQDPVFNDFFGAIRYGAQLETGYVITDDINVMIPGFNEEEEQQVQCVMNGKYRVLHPRNAVDGCKLPQRHILGCGECLEEERHPDLTYCEVKYLYETREKKVPRSVVSDLHEWRHLQKKIGKYTFVSPSCVQDKVHFVGRVVGITGVNFEAPEEHREARQEIAETQERLRQFRETHCTTCLCRDLCGSSSARWCDSKYDKSEEEYSEDILKRAIIPFTDDEFWYLFENAGELKKPYKRKRSYVTFRYRDGLEFVLGHMYSPRQDERPLDFKRAREIIEGHRFDPRSTMPRGVQRTPHLKALLVAMAAITESPAGSADKYFQRYRLPVRYIVPDPHDYHELVQVCFTDSHTTTRFSAKKLIDLYRTYRHIPFVRKTPIDRGRESWRSSRWDSNIDEV